MLSLENDSLEVLRDARLFYRLIKEGKLTLEQARAEILITDRQLELIRADHATHVLRDMVRRRMETWNALVRLFAKRQRESAPASVVIKGIREKLLKGQESKIN